MCSGSEAGSYLRLIDFVYHSTLGLRVMKKKREGAVETGNHTVEYAAFVPPKFYVVTRPNLHHIWPKS